MEIFDQLIESYRDAMIKDIQSLVRIKSVREEATENLPFGPGPQQCLEKALEISARLGFETENVDNYVGVASYGSGDESIAMLGHLDVVPEGNDWTYPPYGAEIHGDIIYGRGVSDNKGPSIMGLYALKAVMDSKLPISKQLRMIFGTNEESGMEDVRYYVKQKGAPTLSMTPDARFPLIHGEKGIMSFKLKTSSSDFELKPGTVLVSGQGGNAVNSVPDICNITLKTDDKNSLVQILQDFKEQPNYDFVWEEQENLFSITTYGVSAHGSRPEDGRNAISYMFSILEAFVKESRAPLAEFIKLYNDKIAFRHHGEDIGCGFSDEKSGNLAFNPGILAVTETGIEIAVNIRYPVTFTGEQVFSGIEKAIEDSVVNLERLKDSPPMYLELDHPLVTTLLQIYREETGDVESKPLVIGGGTYARCLPNAVAFGPGFPGAKSNAHQPNEQLLVDNMIRATKIYAKALYQLAK